MISILNSIKAVLLSSFISTFPQAVAAPLELPKVLRAQEFESPSMLEFPGDERAHFAPLGVKIMLDGVPVSSPSTLNSIFLERYFVQLAGGPVRVNPSGHSMGPTWEYPVGTRVFHEIRLRGSQELFELRFTERRTDGWNFGTYLPQDAQTWVQTQYSGRPKVELKIAHPQTGRPASLRLERIPQVSCQACHFNSSPSSYQYKEVEDAGPCSFGPAHPELIDWAKQVEARTRQTVLKIR